MGGMTRCRADPDGTPNELNKKYYVARAQSAAMITTEAMVVDVKSNAWIGSCTINTKKAVEKWREIIKEVHAHKTYFFAQLCHAGRTVHPDFMNGELPLAPSSIALKEEAHTPNGKKPMPVPKEITKQQIETVKGQFKEAIANAMEAGFDGVEFHGANGYLIDEFLRSGTNKRTDEYGGSVENRSRFLLELVDMALTMIPSRKIGVKLSLVGRYNEMHDDNPQELGKYVLGQLQKRDILYVVMGEAEPQYPGEEQMTNLAKFAKQYFKNLVIADGNVTVEERLRRVEDGEGDVAYFAKMFWANPDLFNRLSNNWPLNQPDFQHTYFGGEKSYTDIPNYTPQ